MVLRGFDPEGDFRHLALAAESGLVVYYKMQGRIRKLRSRKPRFRKPFEKQHAEMNCLMW